MNYMSIVWKYDSRNAFFLLTYLFKYACISILFSQKFGVNIFSWCSKSSRRQWQRVYFAGRLT